MKQLGQLEAQVMDLLWRSDVGLAVRDVRDGLDRPLAYTTVMTVLDNLHSKGLLSREKNGRAFTYLPARNRAEHTADLLERVLNDSGNRDAALLNLVGKMSPDEVARLREALSEDGKGPRP